MKIWIFLNGVQEGPYTLDELRSRALTPDTPVWYDGLPDWTIAGLAPATASLFAPPPPPASELPPLPNEQPCEPEEEVTVLVETEPVAPQWQPVQPMQPVEPVGPVEPRPDTYLVWSILLTVVCCTPLSIAAIVTGALCNSRYNNGDYAGARRMSNATQWLIIFGVVLGVLALPLLFLAAVWL